MLDIMTKISVEFHIFFPKKYHKLCFLYSFPSKNPPYTFFFPSSNMVDIKYHLYFNNPERFFPPTCLISSFPQHHFTGSLEVLH